MLLPAIFDRFKPVTSSDLSYWLEKMEEIDSFSEVLQTSDDSHWMPSLVRKRLEGLSHERQAVDDLYGRDVRRMLIQQSYPWRWIYRSKLLTKKED